MASYTYPAAFPVSLWTLFLVAVLIATFYPSNITPAALPALRQFQMIGLESQALEMRTLANSHSDAPCDSRISKHSPWLFLGSTCMKSAEFSDGCIRVEYKDYLQFAKESLDALAGNTYNFTNTKFQMKDLLEKLFDSLAPEYYCYLANLDAGGHNTLVSETQGVTFIDLHLAY
jgi:hypothetical protein